MSAFPQFAYPLVTNPSPLPVPNTSMSTGGSTGASPGTATSTGTGASAGTGCCDTGRPVATDPVTGHVICSCQYESGRLSLNGSAGRLAGAPAAHPLSYGANGGSALTYGTAAYPSTEHNPYPSIGVDSAAYFSQFANNPYALKDGVSAEMSMYGAAGYRYSAYDPSLYGYGAPYDLAARRKNATREATGTLKAWLNEHKTNPYPTKGEKIMLAIITKMTLTQVSTWFANARRRLKKENKMTWEPKNKAESDDEADKCSDSLEDGDDNIDTKKDLLRKEAEHCKATKECVLKPGVKSECLSPGDECKSDDTYEDCGDPDKPKIWSLAATAAAKSPSVSGPWPQDRLPAPHPTQFDAPADSLGATTFPLPPTVSSYSCFPLRQQQQHAPYATSSSLPYSATDSAALTSAETHLSTFTNSHFSAASSGASALSTVPSYYHYPNQQNYMGGLPTGSASTSVNGSSVGHLVDNSSSAQSANVYIHPSTQTLGSDAALNTHIVPETPSAEAYHGPTSFLRAGPGASANMVESATEGQPSRQRSTPGSLSVPSSCSSSSAFSSPLEENTQSLGGSNVYQSPVYSNHLPFPAQNAPASVEINQHNHHHHLHQLHQHHASAATADRSSALGYTQQHTSTLPTVFTPTNPY